MTRHTRLIASLVRVRRLQAESATQALATAIAHHRSVSHVLAELDAAITRETPHADPQALFTWRAAANVRRTQQSLALSHAEHQVDAARENLRARSSLLELTDTEVSRRKWLNRLALLKRQQLELDETGLNRPGFVGGSKS